MKVTPLCFFVAIVSLLVGIVSERSAVAQGIPQHQVFAERFLPHGIETDAAENIYLQWDKIGSLGLTSFRPDGSVRADISVGNGFSAFQAGRIARIPDTNDMLWVGNGGLILAFGQDLELQEFYNLAPLSFQVVQNAFEVTTGQILPFQTGNPDWGDIAIYRAGPELLFIFITATNGASGGFPFVLRLAFDIAQNQITPSVVAWSNGTTVGNVSGPRGIAVNPQGWVLTGFPFPIVTGGFADTLVALGAGFPDVPGAPAPRFILGDPNTVAGLQDVASLAMTSDSLGNFYVATGVVGSSLCGTGGSSALIVIPPDPNLAIPNGGCFPLPAILSRSTDVAVSPTRLTPYLTVNNQVWRFPALVSQNAATVSLSRDSRRAIDRSFTRRLLELKDEPAVFE